MTTASTAFKTAENGFTQSNAMPIVVLRSPGPSIVGLAARISTTSPIEYLPIHQQLFHLIFSGKQWMLIRLAMHSDKQQRHINDGEPEGYLIKFGKPHRGQLIFGDKKEFL